MNLHSPVPQPDRLHFLQETAEDDTAPNCPCCPIVPFMRAGPGGGGKRIGDEDPSVLKHLRTLVDPSTRGDPMSPLRWTCKSTRQLAGALAGQGHRVSHVTVAEMLRDLGYSLQGNSKTLEGTDHPDRDEQFGYINRQVRSSMRRGLPVVSVDTKKKELIGQYPKGGIRLTQGDTNRCGCRQRDRDTALARWWLPVP